jgi:protein-S-isoprenylcysteine O-methyltransferase Ste14
MSPRLAGVVFVLFAGTAFTDVVGLAGDAIADSSLHAWLLVGFSALKAAVIAAFAYFVVVRPTAKRPARDPVAFAACAAALLGAVALRGPHGESGTPMLLVGEAMAVVSCAWVLASVLALGRCFGILPEARGLVTRGPYRLVRHPVYLGELGAFAGLVIAAPTKWNVATALVILGAQLVRMRLEERALEREFPQYAAYAARIPRLLPRPPWPRVAGRRPTTPLQSDGAA